jgi:hypothetical protein
VGGLPPRLAPVQNQHAQASADEPPGKRETDQAAADDNDVKFRSHGFIVIRADDCGGGNDAAAKRPYEVERVFRSSWSSEASATACSGDSP